jgi:hypothetical protein
MSATTKRSITSYAVENATKITPSLNCSCTALNIAQRTHTFIIRPPISTTYQNHNVRSKQIIPPRIRPSSTINNNSRNQEINWFRVSPKYLTSIVQTLRYRPATSMIQDNTLRRFLNSYFMLGETIFGMMSGFVVNSRYFKRTIQ